MRTLTEILEPFSEASESPVAKAKAAHGNGAQRLAFVAVPKSLRVVWLDPGSHGVLIDHDVRPRKDSRRKTFIDPDGYVVSKRLGLRVLLDGRMVRQRTVLIDSARGVQVDYDGIEWTGIDGKYSYHMEVRRTIQAMASAKIADLLKWAKLAVVLTAVTLAALIISVIVLAGQVGG